MVKLLLTIQKEQVQIIHLTRGQKGCYIYCEDKPLAEYLKSRINRCNGITYSIDEEEHCTNLSVAEESEEYRYE